MKPSLLCALPGSGRAARRGPLRNGAASEQEEELMVQLVTAVIKPFKLER